MKFALREKQFSQLHFQRNLLAGLSICLLILSILQAVLLLFKSERIVVNPPELKQSYWVEGNTFSPSYLEEMGLYFSHLLLDVSAANILYQGDVLLRYVSVSEYGYFKARLLKEQKRLKQENVALSFNAIECKVMAAQMAVEISGDLITYVSDRKISQHREVYLVTFKGKAGRLFLHSFKLLKTDRPVEEKIS